MQIRSLRQLILASFFIALIPLVVLLWQSQHDLNTVSETTLDNSAFFVLVNNEMRALEANGDNVERLVRQFYALSSAYDEDSLQLEQASVVLSKTLQNKLQKTKTQKVQLQKLADNALKKYAKQLSTLCENMGQTNVCVNAQISFTKMSDYASINDSLLLNAYLADTRQSQRGLRRDMQKLINQQMIAQQASLNDIKNRQRLSAAALVVLSITFMFMAAQHIVKPVKKLQVIIRQIAKSEHKLPDKKKQGPKELVAVENDLYWLNNRLQQLEKVRSALLRHASHELKTPIASIKEGCEILDTGVVGELSQSQKEVVNLLTISTERMHKLITKLLDYNALLQQAEPNYEAVDLYQMVEACALQNQLLLVQNNQKIVNEIAYDFTVISDADLLRRAIDNLISNAIAHGKQNAQITISALRHKHHFDLDVLNFGKAISLADRTLIFEPFRRGTNERNDKVTGAGLGLSIVSDCARLLGGRVSIIDDKRADVCFHIRLPYREKSTMN